MLGLNRVKSQLFYKYTLSYLLTFLIPFIIMSAIIYHNSIYSLRQEIEQSNINKLKQAKDMTDARMKELETLAARISYDPRLTPYMTSHGYYGGEAIDELKKYEANSSIIEELFIYYHGKDIIYSSNGTYSLETLSKKINRFDLWKKEDLISDLQTEKPIIRHSNYVTANKMEQDRMIAYLYPIKPNSPNPYGTVMYFIEESVITDLIQNILGEFQGNVYIIDENSRVVASSINDTGINLENLNRVTIREQGVNNVERNGKDYSLVSVKSEISGWTFITLMDTKQFFERVFHVQTFILLILILIVFTGAGAAILLARKHYRPIQSLVELIKINEKRNASFDDRNELESIRNTITKMFKDHGSMCEMMDLHEPFVRDQILLKLLKGDLIDNEETDSLLNSLNIKMMDGPYFVIIVSFDKSTIEKENMKEREQIVNFLSLISFQEALVYGVELVYRDAIALVVSMDQVTSNTKEQRRILVTQIKQHLQENPSITPTIGVGSIYNDKSGVSRSFIEALATIEYKFVNRQGNIIYFEDIRSQPKQALGYPIEEQIKLVQSLKQGDQVIAIEAINNTFIRLANEELPIPLIKCVCFDIINTVLKTVTEIGLNERIHDIESIVDFHSIEQLERNLHKVVIDICTEVEGKKESHNSELRNEILNYIKANYKMSELSLENLAEEFKLSPSYLSRFLKAQTGVTFTECVLHLRMEDVKKRLKETNQSIKEIVTGVGYLDVPNFTRKFKQIEGVTPGQYRKLFRK